VPDQSETHKPPGQKYYFDLLPAHPPPELSESLTSYLLRLAQANRIKTLIGIAATCFPSKRQSDIRRTADMPLQQAELDSLSAATNCPPARLQQTTFYHLSRSLGRKIKPRAMPMFLSGSIADHLRYCPECLAEHPYYRLTWRFVRLTGCGRHSCELLDTCTHCGEHVPMFPETLTMCLCPACDGDLRTCQARPLTKKEGTLASIRNDDLEFVLSAQPQERDSDKVAKEVGSTYAALRQGKGLTSEEVAQALGVTVNVLQSLERGHVRIQGSPFKRYCTYTSLLGVTFQEMFTDE
jgi:ribosome-binding protein aMBF1 (putative translation factor)